MGENKHITELDSLTKKLVKQVEPAKVSVDFTSKVMQQIQLQPKVVFVKNHPLISKKAWFLLSIILGFILVLPTFFTNTPKFNLTFLNFSFFDHLNWSLLKINLTLSNTTFYAIVFFGLMLSIQIVVLKNHYSKKIN